MYKPYHLIGLELGVSVASVGLRREPTGVARDWLGDVVATAKRDLREGERLDGEGGYTVYGKLMPAGDSLHLRGLPLGLAHGVTLQRPIAEGQPVTWNDVEYDEAASAVRIRREMEREFAPRSTGVAGEEVTIRQERHPRESGDPVSSPSMTTNDTGSPPPDSSTRGQASRGRRRG